MPRSTDMQIHCTSCSLNFLFGDVLITVAQSILVAFKRNLISGDLHVHIVNNNNKSISIHIRCNMSLAHIPPCAGTLSRLLVSRNSHQMLILTCAESCASLGRSILTHGIFSAGNFQRERRTCGSFRNDKNMSHGRDILVTMQNQGQNTKNYLCPWHRELM